MTERKSPTAVLHEGPRALSDQQVRQIEVAGLAEVLDVDIDDVIEDEARHTVFTKCLGVIGKAPASFGALALG
jgi:hypothetical protein